MKVFSASICTLLASWACTVGARVVPGADTPLFYFVSTSGSSSPNLLPLRINGGTSGNAALTGTGAIGRLYFYQGKLVAQDPNGSSTVYRPYIAAILGPSGCSTFGPLSFAQGSSSNKCARWDSFQIQSNNENSQLGAKLGFNFQGGFFACGATQDIWYKTSPEQGPADCSSVDLYTVPVV